MLKSQGATVVFRKIVAAWRFEKSAVERGVFFVEYTVMTGIINEMNNLAFEFTDQLKSINFTPSLSCNSFINYR